jgi:pimeloyl-ACP methyl ester carboxylesterase
MIDRRALVAATATAAVTGGAVRAQGARHTFVLLHGAWHGGWCWRRVGDLLQAGGHRVFAPTLTGLGERAHLLNADVGLETHIRDVMGVFEREEATNVVFVLHSYGGVIGSGVADRLRDRIKHLVYLDSLLLEDGQSWASQNPQAVRDARAREAAASPGGLSLNVLPATNFGLSAPEDIAWVDHHTTPHPYKTYLDPLVLRNPLANGLPKTYVECTSPASPPLAAYKAKVRAENWPLRSIATGHDAMVSAPKEVTDILLSIAAA